MKSEPWERQPSENSKAFKYFTDYLYMGESRSLQRVADMNNKGLQNMKNISAKYHWKERVRAYENNIERERLQAAKKQVREVKIKGLETAEIMIDKATERLESIDTDKLSPSDIAAFVKVAMAICKACESNEKLIQIINSSADIAKSKDDEIIERVKVYLPTLDNE